MTIGPYCLYVVKTKIATLRRIKHVNAVVHMYPAPEQRADSGTAMRTGRYLNIIRYIRTRYIIVYNSR